MRGRIEPGAGLTIKAIWWLLIARVVAAPLALPPDGSDSSSGTNLVVRVCAWPVCHDRTASMGVGECRDGGISSGITPVSAERDARLGLRPSVADLSPFRGHSCRTPCHLRC